MVAAYASAREFLGQTLSGKYELLEVLGVGGTAVVYRAKDRDGRHVAVKMLHDYLSKVTDVRRRFMREAYLANMLDHPGTVRVLDDAETDDGTVYLVLELLEGETLEERRVRLGGTIPLDEVLEWTDQLLAVLETAHAQSVVHRDIKPSNIFIDHENTLKMLDFGIARILDDVSGATVTKTGQMVGTPAFMPPEQALSKPREIDAQSDLWAVGATVFTLLSGELVHVAENSSEHLVKAATMKARSIGKVLAGVPERIEAVIAKSLAFYKKDRWASAAEMRHALAVARAEPGAPFVAKASTYPPPRRNPLSDAPTVVIPRSDPPVLHVPTNPTTAEMVAYALPNAEKKRTRSLVVVMLAASLAFVLVGVALTVRAAVDHGNLDRAAAAAHVETPPAQRIEEPTPPATVAVVDPPASAPVVTATAPPPTLIATPPTKAAYIKPVAVPPKAPVKGGSSGPKVDVYRPF